MRGQILSHAQPLQSKSINATAAASDMIAESNRVWAKTAYPLTRARGMHYFTPEGRPMLDGTSGDWHTGAGHCRAPIVSAIRDTAARFDSAPAGEAGDVQIELLSQRLAMLMPPPLEHVVFAGTGITALTRALKIAAACHPSHSTLQNGHIILREGSDKRFSLTQVSLKTAECPTNPMSGGTFTYAETAEEIEDLIALCGARSIIALVIDPLGVAAGLSIGTPEYLQQIRAITKRHGIFLIFDERHSAFGRLGTPTAAERFGVQPDLIVVAESLTNKTLPLGAILCSTAISRKLVPQYASELAAELRWRPDPVATAAALATLDLYEEEELFVRAAELEPYWQDSVRALCGAPKVVDIRGLGLTAAIELETRPGQPGKRGAELFQCCFEYGAVTRVIGDTLILSPPLIISEDQIDEIVEKLSAALRKVT
jgi:beta-alanine--pyruvate transaminase